MCGEHVPAGDVAARPDVGHVRAGPCSSTRMPERNTSTPASSRPRVADGPELRAGAVRRCVPSRSPVRPGVLVPKRGAPMPSTEQDRFGTRWPPRRRILSQLVGDVTIAARCDPSEGLVHRDLVPISWKREANSRPMYHADDRDPLRHCRELEGPGRVENAPRRPMPGDGRDCARREPEATRMFAASWALRRPSTALRPTRRPVPWSTSRSCHARAPTRRA